MGRMSRIYLDCQHCGEALKVVSSLAGMRVRCPSCLSISTVPMPKVHEVEVLRNLDAVEQATIDLPIDDENSEHEPGLRLRLEVEESFENAYLVALGH